MCFSPHYTVNRLVAMAIVVFICFAGTTEVDIMSVIYSTTPDHLWTVITFEWWQKQMSGLFMISVFVCMSYIYSVQYTHSVCVSVCVGTLWASCWLQDINGPPIITALIKKKCFAQNLLLVVFMVCLSLNTLPGLSVFCVQLFPVDYTTSVHVHGLNTLQAMSLYWL